MDFAMINFQELWNKSGEGYRRYASEFPQYERTNRELVRLALPRKGQVIVDLACGTGLTSSEVLKACPSIKKIYAIDFSSGMLAIARRSIRSRKVSFILADVNDAHGKIDEKADIVLCNSAFWQFRDQIGTLKLISRTLKDDGRFIFNLNQQFFDFGKQSGGQA